MRYVCDVCLLQYVPYMADWPVTVHSNLECSLLVYTTLHCLAVCSTFNGQYTRLMAGSASQAP